MYASAIETRSLCFGILIAKCLFVQTNASGAAVPNTYVCSEEVCNVNQFCDSANRLCQPCSNILEKCFTADHVHNCTTYCYDIRHRQDQEKERVAGCRVPTPPAKGRFDNMSIHVTNKTTIIASCDHGYRLSGIPLLQCGDYGIWIGTSPECAELTCTSPPQVFHGKWQLSFPNTRIPIGTTATLHCGSGYRLHGDPVMTCNSNGKWRSVGQYPGCLLDENMAVSTQRPAATEHNAIYVIFVYVFIPLLSAIFVIGFVISVIQRFKKARRKRRRKRRRQDSTDSTLSASRNTNSMLLFDGISVGPCSIAGTMKRYFTSDDITGRGGSVSLFAPSTSSLSSQPVFNVNFNVNVNNSNSDNNSKAPTIDSGISTGDSDNAPRPDGFHTRLGTNPLDPFPTQETAINHDQENELHELIAPSLAAGPVVYLRSMAETVV